jgi:hypothetical protein
MTTVRRDTKLFPLTSSDSTAKLEELVLAELHRQGFVEGPKSLHKGYTLYKTISGIPVNLRFRVYTGGYVYELVVSWGPTIGETTYRYAKPQEEFDVGRVVANLVKYLNTRKEELQVVEFHTLPFGAFFKHGEIECVYLKTETVTRSGNRLNAVALDIGLHVAFAPHTKVYRIESPFED